MIQKDTNGSSWVVGLQTLTMKSALPLTMDYE